NRRRSRWRAAMVPSPPENASTTFFTEAKLPPASESVNVRLPGGGWPHGPGRSEPADALGPLQPLGGAALLDLLELALLLGGAQLGLGALERRAPLLDLLVGRVALGAAERGALVP